MMARTARKQAEPQDSAGIGHNKISDHDSEVLFFVNLHAWNAAEALEKAAKDEKKRVKDILKNDFGTHGVTMIKAFKKAQSEEGAAELRAEDEARARARQYAGVPSGYQFDLLTDRTPLLERAAQEGRRAGLLGLTLVNPYNEASAEGQAFAENWHQGQRELAAGIKAKEQQPVAEIIEGGARDNGGDLDEEDETA